MEALLVLTREQVRRVDQIAIERYGMSGLVLMENAGRGVVDVLLALDPSLMADSGPAPSISWYGLGGGAARLQASPRPSPPHKGKGTSRGVVILAGRGNNAGDGFVIARHLKLRGVDAKVLLLFPPAELTDDARKNYEVLLHSDVPIVDASAGS